MLQETANGKLRNQGKLNSPLSSIKRQSVDARNVTFVQESGKQKAKGRVNQVCA